MQMTARGAHADDVAFGAAVVVATGTRHAAKIGAMEQPAGREDHPAVEGIARAHRGAGSALTQDCAKRGNLGKIPRARMSGLAI